jgi:hypothetical protein
MDKDVITTRKDCALPSNVNNDSFADLRHEIYGKPGNTCSINVIDKKAYVDCSTDDSYSHSKVEPHPLPKVDIVLDFGHRDKVDGRNMSDKVQGHEKQNQRC